MTTPLSFDRRTWMTLEPIHAMIYFTPHGGPAYNALGLVGREHYFAPRMAAAGEVSAELTISTFYNFSPSLVRSCIPSAWQKATAKEILAARYRVADASLREAGGSLIGSPEVGIAAALAREAALVACEQVDGRPLFAAHASLPWPTEDHLVLWHAQTLLREYRGDAHIALLVGEGLSGTEALITHAATGFAPAATLQQLRGWTDNEWAASVDELRSRGILAPEGLTLTALGTAQREHIESRTDSLAARPYLSLGEQRCSELRRTARPLSQALVDIGWSPLRKPPAEE